jgi:energy-coupling factor transporter ATP-binding protein EcfA2
MNNYTFRPAQKVQAKARVGLVGPSGSGKTWTALVLAHVLGERIAVIDTEHGSAAKYAGEEYAPGKQFTYDHLALETFAPKVYIEALHAAEAAGYEVIIVDGLSHAWAGKGGALEMVDRMAARYQGNTFVAWREVTPHHNALVDALLASPAHLIATMRVKTAYEIAPDPKTGKVVPRKIGLAPVQRDGMEYEFDVVGELDMDNRLVIAKTRCRQLAGGIFEKPGEELGRIIRDWLMDGAPAPQQAQSAVAPAPAAADASTFALDGQAARPAPRGARRQALARLNAAFAASGLSAAELRDLARRVFGREAIASVHDLADEEIDHLTAEIEVAPKEALA